MLRFCEAAPLGSDLLAPAGQASPVIEGLGFRGLGVQGSGFRVQGGVFLGTIIWGLYGDYCRDPLPHSP